VSKYTEIQSVFGVGSGKSTATIKQYWQRYPKLQLPYRLVFTFDYICEKLVSFRGGNSHGNVKYKEKWRKREVVLSWYSSVHAIFYEFPRSSLFHERESVTHRWIVSVPSAHLDRMEYCTWINPLKTKRRLLYLKIQSVPCCKHFSSRL
jgi:hypothetical protein